VKCDDCGIKMMYFYGGLYSCPECGRGFYTVGDRWLDSEEVRSMLKGEDDEDGRLLTSVRRIVRYIDVASLGFIFSSWAMHNGYMGHRMRSAASQSRTYEVFYAGDAGRYSKVECFLYGRKGEQLLSIIMRRSHGEYIIIGTDSDHIALDVDGFVDTKHYDPKMLREIIAKYPSLFSTLGVRV